MLTADIACGANLDTGEPLRSLSCDAKTDIPPSGAKGRQELSEGNLPGRHGSQKEKSPLLLFPNGYTTSALRNSPTVIPIAT